MEITVSFLSGETECGGHGGLVLMYNIVIISEVGCCAEGLSRISKALWNRRSLATGPFHVCRVDFI